MVKNEQGFTLVELLVVVVVLGVLTGMTMVGYTGVTAWVQERADQATVSVLNSATVMLAMRDETALEVVFAEVSDELDHLVSEGMLVNRPEPAQAGLSFIWNEDAYRWSVGHGVHVMSLADGVYMQNNRDGLLNGTYTGSTTEIMIPHSMDGEVVKEIWQDVFRVDQGATRITSVVFAPDTRLQTIGRRAFRGAALKHIEFPTTLTTIGDGAFHSNDLQSVTLPDNLELGNEVFVHNPRLTRVTIGSNVTIGDGLFVRDDNAFRDAYNQGGAGTYQLVDGEWVKQD